MEVDIRVSTAEVVAMIRFSWTSVCNVIVATPMSPPTPSTARSSGQAESTGGGATGRGVKTMVHVQQIKHSTSRMRSSPIAWLHVGSLGEEKENNFQVPVYDVLPGTTTITVVS